ncbi:MAG: spore germination protein, partial [Oscillospiraceae bacterium]
QLTAGTSVILIDGINKAIVISTQSMQFRSVQEPSAEGNIRGSREGFTEPLRVNISLIRRLIRTKNLRTEILTIGEKTQTNIALCYNADLVPQDMLNEVRKKLKATKLPVLFDTGYLAPFLQKTGFSFFSAVGYTERPDTAAAKICEGKIVVLANGSPTALITPHFFSENFESMDDYSTKAYFASFIRVMKYIAFFIAVMLPGIFVAIANFTPELFPQQLVYKIAAAEQATPLPMFMEAVLITFLLEIVREAGLRMPKAIGHSVSLVAALIVGDAAVSAGIIGTPIVIVAALTAICSFVIPSMYEPITVLRLMFVLSGGILGPIGIAIVFIFMLYNI